MADEIAVFGASGKQGGAVLAALQESGTIKAGHVTAICGKQKDASELRTRYSGLNTVLRQDDPGLTLQSIKPPPSAIYFMTPNGKEEVATGKKIIEAAVRVGVQHIAMSSVDRGPGGNVKSGVDHWDTKHAIEAFLRSQEGITYTIIRPTAFLENFTPDFNGKVFATVWRDCLNNRQMKLVSTRDVGLTAANALLSPKSTEYANAEINLAGDELSFRQADEIFKQQTGKPLPTTNKFLVYILVWLIGDLNQMAKFLRDTGYGAQIGAHRTTLGWKGWVAQSAHVSKNR